MPKFVEAKNKKRKKLDRQVKSIKQNCIINLDECGRLIPEENLNCVSKCMSSNCYDLHFRENPLEDGEVNSVRWSQFEACVRNELSEQKRIKIMSNRK